MSDKNMTLVPSSLTAAMRSDMNFSPFASSFTSRITSSAVSGDPLFRQNVGHGLPSKVLLFYQYIPFR